MFTSPTPDRSKTRQGRERRRRVLHIVKNYTGDVLNLETAAELCHRRGINVEGVLIDDDAAVKNGLYTAGTARSRWQPLLPEGS